MIPLTSNATSRKTQNRHIRGVGQNIAMRAQTHQISLDGKAACTKSEDSGPRLLIRLNRRAARNNIRVKYGHRYSLPHGKRAADAPMSTMVYSNGRNAIPTIMTTSDANPSPLYAKLLGETAKIDWPELERFYAQGKLLWVARDLDLVSVAEAIASDDAVRVTQWLSSGVVQRMEESTAADLGQRASELWAVVVAPWVCVQERG